jgi:hypothetical protein
VTVATANCRRTQMPGKYLMHNISVMELGGLFRCPNPLVDVVFATPPPCAEFVLFLSNRSGIHATERTGYVLLYTGKPSINSMAQPLTKAEESV